MALRRAGGARRRRLGSHQAAKFLYHRTGAQGWRRYPPGSAGRPASQALPDLGSPAARRCTPPPPQDTGGSPPHGPRALGAEIPKAPQASPPG